MSRKLKTHCVHGHERVPENLLVGGGCKRCYTLRNEAMRGKRTPNPEYIKKYYEDHKEERSRIGKERYANDPEFHRKARERSRRYALKSLGWTPELVEEFKVKQNNCCALCGRHFDKTPHADHDHETNTPRELLCGPCNQALGMLQESPKMCEAAAAYLRKWGK